MLYKSYLLHIDHRSSLVNSPEEIASRTWAMTWDLKSLAVALSGAVKEMVTVTMIRFRSLRASVNKKIRNKSTNFE